MTEPEIVKDELVPELEVHYFNDREYWRLVYRLPSGSIPITRKDSLQDPLLTMAQIRGAIRADRKLRQPKSAGVDPLEGSR